MLSQIVEEEGLMTCTAAQYQRVIEMLLLTLLGSAWSCPCLNTGHDPNRLATEISAKDKWSLPLK